LRPEGLRNIIIDTSLGYNQFYNVKGSALIDDWDWLFPTEPSPFYGAFVGDPYCWTVEHICIDTDGDNVGGVCQWICSDANNDELVNISDIVYSINYKYKSDPVPHLWNQLIRIMTL